MTTINTDKAAKMIKGIQKKTGANDDEAYLMFVFEYTLEQARKSIARDKDYNQLLIDLYPGQLDYCRKEYPDASEEFLAREAKELTEDMAEMFAYEWGE